jgi:hypothetical protein
MNMNGSNNNGLYSRQLESNNPYELKGCLKVLQKCMRRFEHDKNFEVDIYEEIARELGYKEPGTIRKWFNPADQTKTKMGVNDFLSICLFLGTDEPIKALYNDYKRRADTVAPAPADIKDRVLRFTKEVGDVAGVIEEAISDNSFSVSEKNSIQKELEEARQALDKVEELVK